MSLKIKWLGRTSIAFAFAGFFTCAYLLFQNFGQYLNWESKTDMRDYYFELAVESLAAQVGFAIILVYCLVSFRELGTDHLDKKILEYQKKIELKKLQQQLQNLEMEDRINE